MPLTVRILRLLFPATIAEIERIAESGGVSKATLAARRNHAAAAVMGWKGRKAHK